MFWFHSKQVVDVSYASHEPTVEAAVDWLHVHQNCFKPTESTNFPRADGACSPAGAASRTSRGFPRFPLSGNHLMVAEREAHRMAPHTDFCHSRGISRS